ncbi:MAG: dTDP-4-dehydrorhamnose 3,5-epimerase [Oricola sp.]
MDYTETDLPGLWLVDPVPFEDERGSFARLFCVREFEERGLETNFVQHSQSLTLKRGTLRGLHYQAAPYQEAKLVRCVAGAIWDVAVDIRPDSPTYLKWAGFLLTPENRRQVFIPKGFANGFQTLADNSVKQYLISEYYQPEAARGLRYDDPEIGVEWPLPPTTMSEKDQSWPLLADR